MDVYYTRVNVKDTKRDPSGVFFAHIDLRYLMKNALERKGKGKIIKFDLYPLESPQEPIEIDKTITCPKTQCAHDSSPKSTFHKLFFK